MTTPTPAETARAQAASPEMIALNFIRRYTQLDAYGPAMKSLQSDIAQAITAAHAQGWDACVEACVSLAYNEQVGYEGTKEVTDQVYNFACKDIAAAIRQLKGGPK